MAVEDEEKRAKERVCTELPVFLDGAGGTTRDVSASGIYFETTASLNAGDLIAFSVEFDSPNGKMVLKCSGQIVRKESRDDRIGVAVSITESRIELGRMKPQFTARNDVGRI